MTIYDAIMSRRTIRKFKQTPIPREDLIKLVECAGMAAYGANLQPLKFAVIDDSALVSEIFPLIKWAGYLPDGAPKDGEKPVAYIAIIGDTTIKKSFDVDTGAAGTTILLAAEEMGLGACWIASVNRQRLSELLHLDPKFEALQIIALGYPAESSRAVPMNDSVKYYYTEDGVLNVPKRSLEEILIIPSK